MEGHMEIPRLNILINLSSQLLCEALRGLLQKDTAEYRIFVTHDLEKTGCRTEFDSVIVDAAALEQAEPAAWNDAKVILIDTCLPEEEIIRFLFSHKLCGVISTDTNAELFHKALQTIHNGQVWIDNVKLKALLHNPLPSLAPTRRESFSKKEKQIVLLIAEGLKNEEIAVRLNISEHTVKTHNSRIFKKANVTSRAQLVPLALKFKS